MQYFLKVSSQHESILQILHTTASFRKIKNEVITIKINNTFLNDTYRVHIYMKYMLKYTGGVHRQEKEYKDEHVHQYFAEYQ